MAVARKQQQKTLTVVEKMGKVVASLKRQASSPVVINVVEIEKCQALLDNTTDAVTEAFLTKRIGQLRNPDQAVKGVLRLMEQAVDLMSDRAIFAEFNTVKAKK